MLQSSAVPFYVSVVPLHTKIEKSGKVLYQQRQRLFPGAYVYILLSTPTALRPTVASPDRQQSAMLGRCCRIGASSPSQTPEIPLQSATMDSCSYIPVPLTC